MNLACGFCLEVWNIYPDQESYTNRARHWPRHPNLKTVNHINVITESIKNSEHILTKSVSRNNLLKIQIKIKLEI